MGIIDFFKRKMPIKEDTKLQIRIKKGSKGARGTEQADELIEMLNENWDQVQEHFNKKTEEQQEELLAHFESVDVDLGDCLFGDSASPEDVAKFINGKPDDEQNAISDAISEALDIKVE